MNEADTDTITDSFIGTTNYFLIFSNHRYKPENFLKTYTGKTTPLPSKLTLRLKPMNRWIPRRETGNKACPRCRSKGQSGKPRQGSAENRGTHSDAFLYLSVHLSANSA